jgi:DNA (cytosine-5)-methyltransferase 1
MSDLTGISLFDGIGGFPEALRRVGVRTVATVEIDPAAAGVAADHFPEARQFDDVTKVSADDLRAAGFDPVRGLLTGGWPCQDLSLAGRRLGLGGARSGLFWEIVRLAADLRPRWLLLENVPGLLSAVCSCPGLGVCGTDCTDPHPVRGGACGPGRCMELHGGAMGAVVGALGELGYGFAARVLDAQYHGVPQRRRRVVIVGCLGDWAAPAAVLLEPESGAGDPAARGEAGSDPADLVDVGAPFRRRAVNALTSNMAGGGGGADDNTAQGGHLIAGPIQSETGRRADVAFGHTNGLDVQASTDVTPTLRAGHGVGGGSDASAATVRRLTPVECERLQGYPDGWTATSNGRLQSDSARYRQLGNSIAVPVFEWVARRIVAYENDHPDTLDT